MLLSLATSFFVPALHAQNTNNARPGTINYVEGQAALNGQPLTSQSVGSAEVAKGQTVSTTDGKVEVLLTPGVFLRLGNNSAVTMVTPDLTNTEIQLDRGTAEVEVDQLYKENHLLVDQGPSQTILLKNGLYEFDANTGNMRVFGGEAAVSPAESSKKWIKVKSHHEFAIDGDAGKTENFNSAQVESQDPLYSWSKLRSNYLGEANLNLAEEYAGSPGFDPGWFWDPALYSYTWLPGDGMFWSPFGYGFYSPWYLYGGGFIYPGYGFGGGYFGRGFYGGEYGRRGAYLGQQGVHPPYHGGQGFRSGERAGGVRGFAGGGVRSGGFSGGGFRGSGFGGGFHGGGGGGFHGGGGGGGFHGGGGGGRR